jgi:hypothetical protein
MVGHDQHSPLPTSTRRPIARSEVRSLVDRVVALAVREGLKDDWTVHEAAMVLLDLAPDARTLRHARARVSEVVLRTASVAGSRAVMTLNLALARLEPSWPPRVPRQAVPPEDDGD